MPWDNDFYIGTSLEETDFKKLKELFYNFNKPVDPNWTFSPYGVVFEDGNGAGAGLGWASATWSWNQRADAHVEILQTLCPGPSANLYIRTPTNLIQSNARVWRTFLVQMWMPPKDIDFQAGRALGFVLTHRRLIVQSEI